MARKGKDGCLVRSPAPSPRMRARANSPIAAMERWFASLTSHEGESGSFAFSYALGVLTLLQDQPCRLEVYGAFWRLCSNVLVSGDSLNFIDECSRLRAELVQCGELELALSKASTSRWARGLSSAIRHALDVSLCVHPSVEFNRLATFLGWLKRLPVCIRDAEQSVDAYYEADRRLSSVSFDGSVHVQELRQIWHEWLKDFELSDLDLARHGSGSTADVGSTRARKWQRLCADSVADVCLRSGRLEKLVTMPIRSPSREAKVVFVPKQAGKDRTICMEPAWLQYLQQGVARSLIAYCNDTPLRQYIDYRDQTRNQLLCAQAFVAGYSTIDLSDASDSVSWRLIRALSKGLPIYRYLYATRSTTVQLSGRRVAMDKYAPMGSALCFPVESILFASIVELAYRKHYGQASQGSQSGCSVYGDDIVCPSEIYHLVVELLEHFGFKVNLAKSFYRGAYFESCGVEYLYGVRITTIRHPRKHLFCQEELSPEQVETIIDLSNTLASYGSYDARRALLRYAAGKRVRVDHRTMAFFDAVRIGEKGLNPIVDPYSMKTTWSERYQRSFSSFMCIEASPVHTRLDYMDAKFMQPRATRQERMERISRRPREIELHESLSLKAVAAFLRFGYAELCTNPQVQSVGTPGTGRLRHLVRRHLYEVS